MQRKDAEPRYEVVLSQINFSKAPRTMSVTSTATLPVREETVLFLSGLLHTERRRLGTRAGTRSLGCYRQAILVLRWLLDGTRITRLALDNQLSRSTGYAYLYEGIKALAAHAPNLHSVLLAACTDVQRQFNRAHNAPRHRRTRQFAAQDHVQSAAQRQHMPLEHRPDHRRSRCHLVHRTRPHHLTEDPLPNVNGRYSERLTDL